MSILIISDIHLTTKFDQKKFEYLRNLIEKFDKVIINGDFWSHYSCTFNEFIQSEWSRLFPYLKEKTIYIYGNHDRKKWCDDRVNLFSTEQHSNYSITEFGKKLRIEHGHAIAFDSVGNEKLMALHRKLKIDRYNYAMQKLILNKLGKKIYNFFGRTQQKKFLRESTKLEGNSFLVVGHSHSPNFIENKKYINSGYVNFGTAYYIALDNDGLRLVHEKF